MVAADILDDKAFRELKTKLERLETNFRRACDQIVLMNKKLEACNVRYRRAKRCDTKSFRYPLRLRLSVTEGVRNMYYAYAQRKAEQVDEMRRYLDNQLRHVTLVDDEFHWEVKQPDYIILDDLNKGPFQSHNLNLKEKSPHFVTTFLTSTISNNEWMSFILF